MPDDKLPAETILTVRSPCGDQVLFVEVSLSISRRHLERRSGGEWCSFGRFSSAGLPGEDGRMYGVSIPGSRTGYMYGSVPRSEGEAWRECSGILVD